MYDINWHEINWIDYGILALIGISVLMGIFRGFVREAFSLLTWAAAIFIGVKFCEPLGTYFTPISMVILRYCLAFVLIVLAVLILGGIISYLIMRLIKFTGFGVTDRMIGTLFGLARGVLVVAVFISMLTPTPVAKDPQWIQSKLIPRFEPISLSIRVKFVEPLINSIKDRVPEDAIKKIDF